MASNAATAPMALTDGGMETALTFHEGFELPCFAAFPLVEERRGRAAIRRYFDPFLELGYGAATLAAANRNAVAFARQLAAAGDRVIVDGCPSRSRRTDGCPTARRSPTPSGRSMGPPTEQPSSS